MFPKILTEECSSLPRTRIVASLRRVIYGSFLEKGRSICKKKHTTEEKNLQNDKYAGNENLIWFSIFLIL